MDTLQDWPTDNAGPKQDPTLIGDRTSVTRTIDQEINIIFFQGFATKTIYADEGRVAYIKQTSGYNVLVAYNDHLYILIKCLILAQNIFLSFSLEDRTLQLCSLYSILEKIISLSTLFFALALPNCPRGH